MPSNPPRRVLITGATGFIGSRLCEVMTQTGFFIPRAFIHSTASAARITRFPLDFVVGDICDFETVERALEGCEAVVHLARGDNRVMFNGLENVLRAAVSHGVSRFVHMSSIAVYGNSPPAESVLESAPARRSDMVYGNTKLKQERLVLRYSKRQSLPVVILRPPNVYGPYAGFTLDLLHKIQGGRMAILDGGRNPCNLVYVDNLVAATLVALWKPEAIGEIFFVTDGTELTWEQCLTDHAALLRIQIPRITSSQLMNPSGARTFRDSLRAFPRVLLSGELRSVLRKIPVFDSLERLLYAGFQSMPRSFQQSLRQRINGPRTFPHNHQTGTLFFRENIFSAQTRQVAHSNNKAKRLLGYTAPVSYGEGMALTEAWLRYSKAL